MPPRSKREGHGGATAALALTAAVLSACDRNPAGLPPISGSAGAGAAVIARVGCGACHIIPGVRGADGTVGPSLAGLAQRSLIAGTLPNDPERLAAFVRNAPALVPDTGMPRMPISEDEALDVAAFLLTLR